MSVVFMECLGHSTTGESWGKRRGGGREPMVEGLQCFANDLGMNDTIRANRLHSQDGVRSWEPVRALS